MNEDISHAYRVHTADWRSGRVTIDRPHGEPVRLTIGELADAAHQPDRDLTAIYRDLLRRARHEIEASRRESIAQCPGHRAIHTEDIGFSAPIAGADYENRAAHGNICQIETCACGAERRTNINQQHEERGPWA